MENKIINIQRKGIQKSKQIITTHKYTHRTQKICLFFLLKKKGYKEITAHELLTRNNQEKKGFYNKNSTISPPHFDHE